VQNQLIAHECSKLGRVKPFKKCHKSGFTVSFMYFSSQILLLLSEPRLPFEAAL
jgi:hypothetical protein